MKVGSFERTLARLTSEAIDESLAEISTEFDRRFGTPASSIITELRAYAVHLQTWTLASEELAVRPLKQLLEDAAQAIAIRAHPHSGASHD